MSVGHYFLTERLESKKEKHFTKFLQTNPNFSDVSSDLISLSIQFFREKSLLI